MHRYTQDLLQRLMGSVELSEKWGRANLKRFAERCYEAAPACKCGCGEKTGPGDKGRTLINMVSMYMLKGVDPLFREYIGKHWAFKLPENYKPNDYEHQIIIASMVGDGSLYVPYKRSNPSARICWNMGNEKHAIFKRDAFSFIGADYRVKENPGFGKNWYCVRTKSHPIFTRYGDRYGYTKSRVNPDSGIYHELDSVGWAWLYGDDGHYDSVGGIAFIHTESFSLEHVETIRSALNQFIGIDGARVHSYIGGTKKRKMHCIRMTQDGTEEFISRVKENMADGMEYKTGYNIENR